MLEAGLIVSRFLHYVAVLSLFGASLFPLYAVPGALVPFVARQDRLVSRMRRLLSLSAFLALAGGLGWFVFTTASMAGGLAQVTQPAVLGAMMHQTAFGPLWLARLAILLPVIALLVRWPARGALWLVPLLAGLLLASMAGTGHAQTAEGWTGTLHVAADIVHLLAAGLWLGGLWVLGLVIAQALPGASENLSAVLLHFSGVGTIAVAALLGSGLVSSWLLVGSLDGLFLTTYGRLLLVKFVLFLLMALLACANRFWITPKLGPSAPTGNWLRRLKTHVAAEQALAIGVLVLVSILGTLALPA